MNTYQKIQDLLKDLKHWETVAERQNLAFPYRYALRAAILGLEQVKRYL